MNRLARESSPYLRQHADNPVDWYPWGDEAFERAKAEDRPVLLSIGYSACHWCHVMAHESFEDDDVARVMNAGFVSIKVDREERPDVDAIYMEATQALTGSGGWPMTVFLTPDRRPFFAGTYFPKRGGYGRPGFLDVLAAVQEAWRDRRAELDQQADQLTEAVRARSTVAAPPAGAEVGVGPDVLARTAEALVSVHDAEWGGFGRAPKFPMTSNLDVLLRAYAHSHDHAVLGPVLTTLDAMASGGIYDHLGGGFARYSVDAFWMVPHFEKMLYDNALIPRAYVRAWQVTGEPRYRQVVEETIAYVRRDLGRDDGGLYSAEDADSEGEEGKFYVWRPEEIRAAGADAAIEWYGVTAAGNFEGSNILHRPVRGDLLRPPEVEDARRRLFDARCRRVRPGLDDKVVTEWNAMWAATAAEAGAAMGHDAWVEAAAATADFLLARLRRDDGRWLRVWHPAGGARHLAYAVDYAHLVDAFTCLAEATGQARWVAEARTVADAMLDLFWDGAEGGLFSTGTDAEPLLVRSKDVYDGATPSANSVAALALGRLGALTGHEPYTAACHGILRLLHGHLTHQPTSVTVGVATVDLVVSGATEIVVAGDRPDLVGAVQRRYLPNAVLAWGEPYPSPLWEGRERAAAYVCRNFVCGLPAESEDDLAEQLDAPV
ncbi:MAG TPA: thioredoxin domain-containing protein [Acidimicrobiales bacterium]|nr:thioredoxin domain-containing protein [Acidimicrobiales bacterium]